MSSYQSINRNDELQQLRPQQKSSGDNPSQQENLKFLHYDYDELEGSELPITVYTSAMICALGFTKEELSEFRPWLVVIPNWLIVFFNYFFSFVVILAIKELRDVTPECEANFTLLMVSVIAFSTYNVGEIFETFSMFFWIYSQPTSTEHVELTFSSDDDDREITSGMTMAYKLWCYFAIILPKLAIGIMVAYFGNTFLLVSDSNQDVILNSMALGFITQNDEIIFDVLVPKNLKAITENMPAMKITRNMKLWGLYRPWAVSLLILIIVLYSYADVCLDDPVSVTGDMEMPGVDGAGI